MGMAASQARYLALVARKSNCEFEGQQINQARTALSNQSANLFNQMLGLQVPVPPSTQEFTKVQYSFSDGMNSYTIDSWNQLASPNPDCNYIVNYHYTAEVYTGSQKQMKDPQIQFAGTVPTVPTATQISAISQALQNIENAQNTYNAAYKAYMAELTKAKQLSNYATNNIYNYNITNAAMSSDGSTVSVTTNNMGVRNFIRFGNLAPNQPYLTDNSGNIIYQDANGNLFVGNSPQVGQSTNFTPVGTSQYSPDVNTYFVNLNSSLSPVEISIDGNRYANVGGNHYLIDAAGNLAQNSIEDIITGLTQIVDDGNGNPIYNNGNGLNVIQMPDGNHYYYTASFDPTNPAASGSIENDYANLMSIFATSIPVTTVVNNGVIYNISHIAGQNYIDDGTNYYLYDGITIDTTTPQPLPLPAGAFSGLVDANGTDVYFDGTNYYAYDGIACWNYDNTTHTTSANTALVDAVTSFSVTGYVDSNGNIINTSVDGNQYVQINGKNYLYPSTLTTVALEDIIAPANLIAESIIGYPSYYGNNGTNGDSYILVNGDYYLAGNYDPTPGATNISLVQEQVDLLTSLNASPAANPATPAVVQSAIQELINIGAIPADTNMNSVYVDQDGNIAFISDLSNLRGIAGNNTSLTVYNTNTILSELAPNTGNLAVLEDAARQAEIALHAAEAAYGQLSVPTYLGNCKLTPILSLTAEQEAEVQQIVEDMNAQGINADIINCFDINGNYIGASLYTFTMNGKTYYTTYNDLTIIAAQKGYNNDIDAQLKLPYYNASYITKNIEDTKRALLETDSSGRFSSIRFEDDSACYDLKTETITDEAAYEDAMNKYYYENAQYDKTVQDINAKTSLIQQQDRTLELRLKQLDTEQNALKTEMEAVKKVVEDNIKNSFDAFKG